MDELSLPASDQPCKECKRRKAKCDRGIPECSNCIRSHRHCLYERHSRTPLTRKHLTQVEARLERAEALLKQHRIVGYGTKLYSNGPAAPLPGREQRPSPSDTNEDGSEHDPTAPYLKLHGSNGDIISRGIQSIDAGVPMGNPEDPPAALEDLDWDEQTTPMVFGDSRSWRQHLADLSPPSGKEGLDSILDGMAMLSVDGKDIGYVGVASGAAFLRYLWHPTKAARSSDGRQSGSKPQEHGGIPSQLLSLPPDPASRKVIADSFVDAYFSIFHPTLPLVHEATFRAIYEGRKPRPSGPGWTALANIVAAIGSFSAMTECLTVDTPFFHAAKASLSLNCLETGSLTLVQALALMSYYFQKRNKPNSGYTYAGLAVRTAFGLGLHREFPTWNLSPLRREVRRRAFWSIFIVDSSICMTLSRPVSTVRESTDIPFPSNVTEAQVDELSDVNPVESLDLTIYSPLRAGATFYLAADNIYKRLIKLPYPDLDELLRLDEQHLGTWHFLLPPNFREAAAPTISDRFALAHHMAMSRYRNLRIIMFRPFVIPLLQKTAGLSIRSAATASEFVAYERCLTTAHDTISATSYYWRHRSRTRLAAWYMLYFSFQATLIPLVCLRNAPACGEAPRWRADIRLALEVIEDIHFIHGSKCAAVIHELADPYLKDDTQAADRPQFDPFAKAPDRMLETRDFSMLFPTDGSFDLEADVAWHMIWPDSTAHDPVVGFDSDGSAASLVDGPMFDILPAHMDFQWPTST